MDCGGFYGHRSELTLNNKPENHPKRKKSRNEEEKSSTTVLIEPQEARRESRKFEKSQEMVKEIVSSI